KKFLNPRKFTKSPPVSVFKQSRLPLQKTSRAYCRACRTELFPELFSPYSSVMSRKSIWTGLPNDLNPSRYRLLITVVGSSVDRPGRAGGIVGRSLGSLAEPGNYGQEIWRRSYGDSGSGWTSPPNRI